MERGTSDKNFTFKLCNVEKFKHEELKKATTEDMKRRVQHFVVQLKNVESQTKLRKN